MRYALNRRRSGPDDPHPFIVQLVQTARGIAPRVVVVPPAPVGGVAREGFNTRNCRELGAVQRSARHHDKSRLEKIATIGGNCPPRILLVPACLFYLRLKAGPL